MPGASDVFLGGVIAYANDVKRGVLGVPASQLEQFGAVSDPVAIAMADGVRALTHADWTIAVTGIAGPGGATPGKPVGTVWLAVAVRGAGPHIQVHAERLQLAGNRSAVREQTVRQALRRLHEAAS